VRAVSRILGSMNRSPIKVAIADDHYLTRSGFRRYLGSFDDVEVVGEANDAFEALELVQREEVDVLILDYSMPGMTGLTALPRILECAPDTRVVMVSSMPADMLRDRALRAGACEYVEKSSGPERLEQAIRAAAAS